MTFRLLLITAGLTWGGPLVGQTSDIVREHEGRPDPDWDFEGDVLGRADAGVARRRFADTAELYDREWRHHPPTMRSAAINRGRAHLLAGNVPRAIRAFRDGLAVYPADADLQHDLLAARAAVNYPAEPLVGLRYRVSPVQLLLASVVSSLLLTAGLAARLTSRPGWATPVAVIGLLGVIAVAGMWRQIERETDADRADPVLVVRQKTPLRAGNGTSYPPRLDAPLPAGAEVRRLHSRGGWVQVEVPGGAVGWLPETTVMAGIIE